MRKVAWLAGIATAIAVGFAAWLIGGWGGESTVRVVDDLGLVGFALFATVCCGIRRASVTRQAAQRLDLLHHRGRRDGRSVRRCGRTTSCGPDAAPFPSLADVGYLVFPSAVCLGLVLFPVGYSGHSRTRLVLDGLIVAGALFEVAWVLVFEVSTTRAARAGSQSGCRWHIR